MLRRVFQLHRKTTDISLAPLFGYYFQKLKGRCQTFSRFGEADTMRWWHKWEILKYWAAELRIATECFGSKEDIASDDVYVDEIKHLHVSLTPRDQAYFEFFTTGKPLYFGTIVQNGVTLSSVKAACIGVDVSLDQGAMTVSPRILTGVRSASGQEISAVKRPFQVQLIDEPVSEMPLPSTKILGRPKFLRTLYESYAPMHSHTGVHLRSYNLGRMGSMLQATAFGQVAPLNVGFLAGTHGASSSHATRDVLFDTPYQDGDQGRPVRDAVLNDAAVDWPRANGIQTVKDVTFGTREFAIYIDAFSNVSAFPTNRIGAVNGTVQNVPGVYVKTQPAAMPGWVYQMSQRFRDWYAANATTGLTEFPENDWKISHDGKKACAVVYKRTAVAFDATFCGSHFSSSAFFDYYHGYTGYGSRSQATVSASSDQRYISATGLLELTIAIALTGPEDEDFTLAVTCTTVRDPETTPYCTLFAGYVWHDMADGSAVKGDLCVWDIERYYRLPTIFPKVSTLVEGGVVSDDGAVRIYAADVIGSRSMTLDEAQTTLGACDHERFWGDSANIIGLGVESLPHAWDSPLGSGGLSTLESRYIYHPPTINDIKINDTLAQVLDNKRTLVSLKNLTQSTELHTFPMAPSGVARPYYIPPFGAFNPNSVHYSGWSSATVFVPDYDTHIHMQGHGYGEVAIPFEPRAQFQRVDMSTLSFVLMFQTSTVEWRMSDLAPHMSENQWFTYHPACAVYTFNTLREVMTPASVPLDQKAKLTDAATDSFRAKFMNEGTPWTFMPLAGGPPGKSGTVDWTDSDMNLLRYWILAHGRVNTSLRAILPTGFDPQALGELCYWWGMIEVYGWATGLLLINNPRFHWYMYDDLIMNALGNSPWSTFFVHPNGTWTLYDQSRIYNKNGIPKTSLHSGDGVGGINYVDGFDAANMEHCIFDRVHLQFTLGDKKTYTKDTTFVQLYNDAVTANSAHLSAPPPVEVFDHINLVDLQARFTKLPNGTLTGIGLSLQMDWLGDTAPSFFADDSVPYKDFGYVLGGNSGIIDLSLDYWFGGVSPQTRDQRATFSSCLLVETL